MCFSHRPSLGSMFHGLGMTPGVTYTYPAFRTFDRMIASVSSASVCVL